MDGDLILVIDNYDSFTYNLVHLFGELGAEVVVRRNDAIDADEAERLAPSHLVVSPGPGRPEDAGVSIEVIRRLAQTTPILGVCLGHQAIGEAFGGRVVRADRLMHGKTTMVAHTGHPLFNGIPSPVEVMRYHSLVVSPHQLPAELEIVAWSSDRQPQQEIMALSHQTLPVYGVQFHPESVATLQGKRLLANFLSLAGISHSAAPPVTV